MRFVFKDIKIPIDMVKPSPFQPRIKFNLDELETSIKQDGILQKLLVRLVVKHYELIDGERRWRVAKKLGFTEVPCDVIEADDSEARRLVWTLNTQRKDYEPKEKALYFQKLMKEQKMSLRQIAEEFGVSHSTVIDYLNVLKLPEQYQEMVWNGQIKMGIIRELQPLFSSGPYGPQITELLNKVVKQGWTQKQLREALKPTLKKIEQKKVEEAKKLIPEIPVKLETPQAYEEAAKLLKRKAEELKPPEEKVKILKEKVDGAFAKLAVEIEKAKKLGVDTSKIEEDLRKLKEEPIERAKQILNSARKLRGKLKALVEEYRQQKKEREIEKKLKKQLEEKLKKQLLSKPRVIEEAWETAKYNELCERFPFLKQNKNIISEGALKPLIKAFEKGKGTSFQYLIMQDLEKEVEKHKQFKGRKRKLTSKDVARIASKYVPISTAKITVEDPEYEEALHYYPRQLVDYMWQKTPKTKRLKTLKTMVKIMYTWLETRIDEILTLALKKT